MLRCIVNEPGDAFVCSSARGTRGERKKGECNGSSTPVAPSALV